MARYAQDREDLLRDAKALVQRVELQVIHGDHSNTIFAGFRANGALSLYFDQDPAYHFTSNGQIRRAYWEGQLIKAEQGQLVALRTSRTDTAVEMLRHEMLDSEQQQFCNELIQRLQKLTNQLQQGQFEVRGSVPDGSDVIGRLQNWLNQFQDVLIAETPRVA